MSVANKEMGRVRVAVEWLYEEIKLYWTTTDFNRKMQTSKSPAALLFLKASILLNIQTCLFGNKVGQFFKYSPPKLDKYHYHKDNTEG